MKTKYVLAVAVLAVLAAGSLAAAGPASFRPQSTQKASETPQVSVDVARSLAIRDGKPVVAGLSRKGSRYAWALARYRTNGRLDPSFGSGGRVLTLFPLGGLAPEGALAVATQADGKVVAAGGGGFALARYTVRGRLDPSFGRNGRLLTDFSSVPGGGPLGIAASVAVTAEGKIVAAGWTVRRDLASGGAALVRYSARGRPDTSFGEGGKVVLSSYGGLTAVAAEPDGKIVALGWIGQPMGLPTVVVLRFTSGGELDPSFGQGGQVRVDSLADVSSSFLLQPDRKIVVAGNLGFRAGGRAVLVRYTGDGTLDPSFGTGGEVVASDGPENLSALALEPDGKLVAAGVIPSSPSVGGPGTFIVVRYTQNGSLDPSFGQGGTMLKAFPLNTAAVQADGKIVTAGNNEGDFVLARYTSSGSLDPRFGSGGRVVTAFGPAWSTKLASLSATRANGVVVVRWRTASEFDARYFNVYREQNGSRLRRNRALLRAKGADLAASYSFRDRRAPRSARRYWLQEVTVAGNLRWFGPVTVRH
jgi:uncharacterized delta-60 repeat protein